MDNLQSMTYQTFEQDPVKYERYEEVGEFVGLYFEVVVDWGDGRRFSERLWSGPQADECKH